MATCTPAATKFENLTLGEVCTSKAIRWEKPTKHRILVFCARHRLSQHVLHPRLLGQLMGYLGWDREDIGDAAYKSLAKRVARHVFSDITVKKLAPAFTEIQHGTSYTVTWRSYTDLWNDAYDFDLHGTEPPADDPGTEREPVTRVYLTQDACIKALMEMRATGDFAQEPLPQPTPTQTPVYDRVAPISAQPSAQQTPTPIHDRPASPPAPPQQAATHTHPVDSTARTDVEMAAVCHPSAMLADLRTDSCVQSQTVHPVLRSIAVCMAEHDSSSFSFDSAVNWLMNSPFAPNQVSEALKRGLAAHDIFEQGASMLRAKDIEIKALQEHARTSLGFEQIYTIEDFIQKLQNQLDSKDSRIESLSQALAKEQGEGSIREQQCKQQRTEIGELHQQNNDLCAQVEMFRNALSTTQQDNQAKDDRLRRGLEENEALRLEVNRIPQIDMLTESLDNMRRAALKDQERLLEQAREIETLRGKLTAVQEDQLMMRIRELSAANDGLTSRLVEQNKQLGDLVTEGLSEQPEVQEGEDVNKGGEDVNTGGEHVKRSEEAKGDVLSKIGLKASMWATQSGSSIHTQPLTAAPYQHRNKGKDRRQETPPQRQRRSPTQHSNDLGGLSTTVTTPPPVPLGSKPSSYSGHHSQDRDIRMADVEEPERGDPQHNTAPYPVFTPRLISQRSSTPTSPKFGKKSSLPAKSRYYATTHLDHGSYSGPESDGEDE